MNIAIGKFYINKTKRFLYPCLKGYGDLFKLKFEKIYKLAVGIHDCFMNDTFSYIENKIYILVDSKYNPRDFASFLKWIRLEPYYVIDYVFSTDFKYSRKHMIVLQVPQEYFFAYQSFIESRYSLMYTEEQIISLFSEKNQEDCNILRNNNSAKKEMRNKIQLEFEENCENLSLDFLESELPLKGKEEVFNYSKNKIFFEKENLIL